ncbi:unnamed protein product [Effrenium voratum]|nr:unnamed protein product [Effrenium voratum]
MNAATLLQFEDASLPFHYLGEVFSGCRAQIEGSIATPRLISIFSGSCHDASCRFAHSLEELRAPPDLTKTAMCRAFARGECKDSNCQFAHGESELRVTHSVYKTQLCNFFMRGHCKKGSRCRHAHGSEELRSFQPEAQHASAIGDTEKDAEPKPLSPGRVHKGARKTKEPLATSDAVKDDTSGGPDSPGAVKQPRCLTASFPGFEDSSSLQDVHSAERTESLGRSAILSEVPMKIPLPRRPGLPWTSSFDLHTGMEKFDSSPSSLVPTPPLASYSPCNDLMGPWRSDATLPFADPSGLATAVALQKAAAANLASMHAWTWASAVKANYGPVLPCSSKVPIDDLYEDSLIASLPIPCFAGDRETIMRRIF